MKNNNRAQALVEFVLVLPILLMLMLTLIDFGKIILAKNHLENKTNDVIDMFNNGHNYAEVLDYINEDSSYSIMLAINEKAGYKSYILKSEIDLITPGINLILDDPFEAKVERVVVNE